MKEISPLLAPPQASFAAEGRIVRQPPGNQNGYWAGAPGVFYEPGEKAWYLTYRLRRPRGVPPDRGGTARIAWSTDLIEWQDIWSVNKSSYDSASIERSAIRRGAEGVWRYFTSYVDPTDGRWCVAILQAADVSRLDAKKTKVIFTAPPLGLEGIKDPWIMEHKGLFYMFLSVAVATPRTTAQSHSSLDIYNTGECLSATGLATSSDLDHWEWKGIALRPAATGWDRYCRRINSVVPTGDGFLAYYDGSASHEENYEEKTGLAVSSDLMTWTSLTEAAPAFTSPHGSGSLRYMDAQADGDKTRLFYEFARPDGAHDLRLLTMSGADGAPRPTAAG
jgi:hypothetical protein